ncbi:hypothetical protein [Oceaniglobus indicus]|uniref:hypothetical protein n=1 Tax=Oceaniglobus indicus TaxID=2047749 RepID=UPI000C18CC6C|nr:hypothetical protein [Oceaniglobus indicus]
MRPVDPLAVPERGAWAAAIRRGAMGLAALCGALVAWSLWRDLARGGDPWRQGDWLINGGAGAIRRGPFGSAMIALSDLVGASPVGVVVAVQFVLFAAALAILLAVFARLLARPVWALLLTSPAFFVLFWAARPEAGMRKELLAFAAMALMFAVPARPGGGRLLLCLTSAVLFVVACVAHEAMAFLAPAYGVLFIVLVRPDRRAAAFRVGALVFVGAIAAAFWFAWTHSGTADAGAICAPLLARGADGGLCIGAIEWMAYDLGFGRDLLGDLLNKRSGAAFLLAYGLAGVPLLYLIALHDRWAVMLGLTVVLLVPLLPLYAVAVDWGRWMSLHVTAVGMILMALALRGDVVQVRAPRMWLVAAICLANLFWVPDHVIGLVPGGLMRELAIQVGVVAPPAPVVPGAAA